jgi:hypothetical protein
VIAGRWFISRHAVDRYRERIRPGLTYEEALSDLIRLSGQAHFVKNIGDGIEFWRTGRPHRLRFRVSTRPSEHGDKPQLLTVLAGKDPQWR